MCDYMEDCIHLKACRRMNVRAQKEFGKKITRGCNENCTAYEVEHTSGYAYYSGADTDDKVYVTGFSHA